MTGQCSWTLERDPGLSHRSHRRCRDSVHGVPQAGKSASPSCIVGAKLSDAGQPHREVQTVQPTGRESRQTVKWEDLEGHRLSADGR